MDKEFLEQQSKEQLIIFLKNTEYQVKSLHQRMEKLTGCPEFGNVDGMNGACVECFYDNPELFDRCEKFTFDKNKNYVIIKEKEVSINGN